MPMSIEAITTAALSAALDAASRRHEVLAANIAHANAEGFVPLRASFEAQFDHARAVLSDRNFLDASAVDTLRQPPTVVEGDGGPVRLDVETAELARNAVQHQALTTALSRHLSLQFLAAGDGRR